MNVRMEILFESPNEENMATVRRVALALTNYPPSVRVVPRDADPRWVVADFTMPKGPQYKVVERIDGKIRFSLWNRLDSIVAFPKSERNVSSLDAKPRGEEILAMVDRLTDNPQSKRNPRDHLASDVFFCVIDGQTLDIVDYR